MQVELVAAPRAETGKEAAKKMRNEGRLPAALYGHGFNTTLLSLDERSFKALLRHEKGLHGLLNLKVEGDKGGAHTVVVKEVQRHPIKGRILHVDFQKIRSDEEVHTEVALQFVGEPAGVKAGGILQHYLYGLTVACLPGDLPEYIEIDVSGLNLKENLRISNMPQLEGIRYVNNPEEIVVAVTPKRVKEEVREVTELFEEVAPGEAAAAGEAAAVRREAAGSSGKEDETE